MNRKLTHYLGSLGICILLMFNVGCSTTPSASIAVPTLSPSTPPPSPIPTQTEEEAIKQTISQLTLEEKIGQLILVGIDGTKIDQTTKEMISEQHVGGIIFYKKNFNKLGDSIQLVNDLKAANKGNPIPLFLSVDQEGGKVSRLPKDFVSIPDSDKVGRTNNEATAKEMGSLLARELQIMGLNVNFAPVLDIKSNLNNPISNSRFFGDNASQVSKMGIAVMKGMQEEGTIPVVKHFPGHGDTTTDSHLDLPVVKKTTEQLEQLEWIPFKAAIEEGADVVMIAHILFPLIDPDVPASMSQVIINEQLRSKLGFNGVVITDDMTMGAISDNYGIEEASVRSLHAGSDIILIAHGYETEKKVYDTLLHSVKSNLISESRIDESVYRILALKRKYQLSDDPVTIPSSIDSLNDDIRQWLKKLN